MDTSVQHIAAGTSAAIQANIATVASDGENASADFETFLILLTAQLRNQDPLSPIDSTQFVAQLATFSSVEQQVKTNDLLAELAVALGGNAPEKLAGLIGREVPAPLAAIYNGQPVDIRFQPVAGALSTNLVVRDTTGATLARLPIDAKSGVAQWDGTLQAGTAQTAAAYTFEIESLADGTVIDRQPGLTFSPVTQIRFAGDIAMLGFSDGSEIPVSEILAVRSSAGL